jgi:hypothetical protein
VLGMVICGTGAGLLNGETAKVGMSAMPAARSGMASGITGTARFTGLVLGIAALGAIFFLRTSKAVESAFPQLSSSQRTAMVHRIVAGDFTGSVDPHGVTDTAGATHAFAEGYQALLASASITALIAACLSWSLVRAGDTAPIRRPLAHRAVGE